MTEFDQRARSFALETFGRDGLQLRARLPTVIQRVHVAHAGAQAHILESGVVKSPSMRTYGAASWDLFTAVAETFPGQVEGAQAYRPAGSPYEVLFVHDVLVYPIRCSEKTDEGYRLGRLTPHRERLLTGKVHPEAALFPAPAQAFEPEELSEQEQEIVSVFHDAASQSKGVVAVVVGSSYYGIEFLEWGPASLHDQGRLVFPGFHEDLMWGIDTARSGRTARAAQVNGTSAGLVGGLGRPNGVPDGFDSGAPDDHELSPRTPGGAPPPSGDIPDSPAGGEVEDGSPY